jgi:hypothetical protein
MSFTAVHALPFPLEPLPDRVSPAGNTRGRNRKVAMGGGSKTLYTCLSITTSVAGGLLAGEAFNQIWKRLSGTDQPPPEPKDLNRSTRAALAAAGLQGLVFGLVRAAVDRAGARGYQAITHESPV